MLRPTAGFHPVPPLRRAPSSAALVFALLMSLGAIGTALLSCPRVLP